MKVLRWFYRLWDWDASRPDDPEFPDRTPGEARRLREELRDRRERDEKKERDRKEQAHEIDFLLMQVAREAYRMRAQFAAELADMRLAILRAYEQASADEAAARAALEDAKHRAVVLPDGRRVYFTADGSGLYDEDGNRITDVRAIDEARERRSGTSTTREEFVERRTAHSNAEDKTKRLDDALVEIEDIERQLTADEIGAEQVQVLRKRARQMLETLPPEVRDAYARMQLKPVEPEPSEMILATQFRNAISVAVAVQAKAESESAPDAQMEIAYRAAPEF